ncbi:bifunctional precorrin-2 dehydrogenase/sirohydrochlorin ferrochelatase [uncultured Methanolobus sp.]|uniref:precorrin-2 dehydrogenase/sirohydrochlorin ferrochelatase family protein n=1 Tax=uncultured Methanolobus sp. TaxID=218300 RepID=UPI002AAC1080|nr:bifunctional precorrin-2 dehydrogenase/sirohydrochlorin ferrochelatase [uncultured Methanolobus sp.]
MKDKNHFLPLLIDMSDKKVVIFGSGSVGERKANLFSEYAKVTVVSRSFYDVFYELEEKYGIRLIKADAGKLTDDEINDIIRDAFLVIPATNDRSINERIVNLSKSLRILTNEVDAIGDVTVPAVIKRGGLTISISTLGSSPAFSRFTRRQVENIITPEFGDMIRIQDEMRTYLKAEVSDQRDRKEILWNILESEEVWTALEESYEKGFNTAQGIVRKKMSEKVR